MVKYCHDRNPHGVIAVADTFGRSRERGNLAAEYFFGQHFRDNASGSGNIASFAGEDHVILNEIPMQDQVAVNVDDVFPTAGGNGFVADGGYPESSVLVPDVVHGNRRDVLEVLYDIAGAHARSVVRNQDFGGHDGLLHHAVEAKVKRPRPVVSGNDQRYCHRTVKLLVRLGVRGWAIASVQNLCRGVARGDSGRKESDVAEIILQK